MLNDNIHLKKSIQLGTFVALLIALSGCAGNAETDWASSQDPLQDQLEVGDLPGEEESETIGDNDSDPSPEDPGSGEDETPPVSTPDPKVFFYTNGKLYNLARNKALKWEGCKSSAAVRGGYLSDTSCGNAYLYDKFVTHLNKHFYTCVESAAVKANLPQPSRVFINHIGSYNDRTARGSSRLSMHAYARALDIKNFNLIDSRGNVSRISTHINNFTGSTAKFYDGFRSCWKATMPSGCVSGQTEYQGSIGHNKSSVSGKNSLHNDHIHLSFPFCAGA
ncbi:extensin family protein [bacterium]|nr:extensin family protein [bacterium]